MTMTCGTETSRLSDYLDDALSAVDRRDVDVHLAGCESCRHLLVDLARVRNTAQSLGPVAPPDHLWLEIAGRIQLETPQGAPTAAPSPRAVRRSDAWQWLGLAAALLLVTAGVYVAARPDGTAPAATTAGNAEDTPTVETLQDTLRRAEAEYEKAIAQLEVIVTQGSVDVAPETLEMLKRNVSTIDSVIAESRAALSENPASQPARTSLFEALGSKVSLLQSAVVLMNEMRQGDADGAAEAAGPRRIKSS
jgi:hypothetical protein